MRSLSDASSAMQNYASDAVVQEQYRAALEVYCRNLEMQQEKARQFLRQHQEMNAQIFREAVDCLSFAVDAADVRLAENALKLIETMRETEPDFYRSYYKIRFGK